MAARTRILRMRWRAPHGRPLSRLRALADRSAGRASRLRPSRARASRSRPAPSDRLAMLAIMTTASVLRVGDWVGRLECRRVPGVPSSRFELRSRAETSTRSTSSSTCRPRSRAPPPRSRPRSRPWRRCIPILSSVRRGRSSPPLPSSSWPAVAVACGRSRSRAPARSVRPRSSAARRRTRPST